MHSAELSRTECSHLYQVCSHLYIRIYYLGCHDGFDGAVAVAQVVDKLVRSRLIGFREEHLLHQLVADNDATLVSTFREVRHLSRGCRNSKL